MVFPTKRDIWLGGIFGAITVLLIWGIIDSILYIDWATITLLSPVLLFILLIWFRMYYKIKADTLIIIYGPFSKKIDINQITSIRHSRSILSAPALSLDRLEINTNKFDTVLISPKDKELFMETLLNIQPNITIVD